MQLEAQDLCFMLSNSVGNPINWNSDVNNTVFFGLKKDKDISLDQLKLDEFNNDNYFVIIDKMNITHNLGIVVEGVNSSIKYVEFGVFPDNDVVYANYQCFAFYNSEIVKVFVEVWE